MNEDLKQELMQGSGNNEPEMKSGDLTGAVQQLKLYEATAGIIQSPSLAEAERAVILTLQAGVEAGVITGESTLAEIRDALCFTMNDVLTGLFKRCGSVVERCKPENAIHFEAHFVAGALVSVGFYDELLKAGVKTFTAKENDKCMSN